MSLNKVQLIGNVGRDPEVRYLDSGVAVATFPLATTDRAYTLTNGTRVPEGKIRSRSYDDQNGVKRYVVEIFGDNMEMLSPRAAQQTAPQQPATEVRNAAQTPVEPAPSDELPF